MDFYILRCESDVARHLIELGLYKALHVVLPATVKISKTFTVTVRSMMDRRWSKFVNNTDQIAKFEENPNG